MIVIIHTKNSADRTFFMGAANEAGFPTRIVHSDSEACKGIIDAGDAIVVVDATTEQQYKSFEAEFATSIGLFSGSANPNHFIFVGDTPIYENPWLVASDIFGHYVSRNYQELDKSLVGRFFKMIGTERAFGIENFFSSQAKSQLLKITQTSQKGVMVEQLKDYLIKIGFKSRVATTIATSLDELVMNAIFDAPVDEMGKQVYAQTQRNADFKLDEKHQVDIKIIFDGTTLGLSVIDQHGSLNKKKLLVNHLGKSYQDKNYEMKTITVGAGLGLGNVYRTCSGLMLLCESGVRTEVNIFYRKTASFKEFKDQFKFLSTFMYFS